MSWRAQLRILSLKFVCATDNTRKICNEGVEVSVRASALNELVNSFVDYTCIQQAQATANLLATANRAALALLLWLSLNG